MRTDPVDASAGGLIAIAPQSRRCWDGGTADGQTAFVYRPARSPVQSGPRPRDWILRLEPQRPLFLDPLTGWTGGDDPAHHVQLRFPTCEAAVAFGTARGWHVHVLPERDEHGASPDDDRDAVRQAEADVDAGDRTARPATGDSAGLSHSDETVPDGDALDEALALTFPASDPVPLWAGRIGLPARRTTA